MREPLFRRPSITRFAVLVTTVATLCALGGVVVSAPASATAASTTHISRAHVATGGPLAPNSFWLATSAGGLYSYGVPSYGAPGGSSLNQPIVNIEATTKDLGYWLVAADGGIFNYGNAHYYGSTGAIALNKPIVGMAATHDQLGYWLVATDGGIFSFGDASFYGSTGAIVLNKPIVGMTPTPDGKGYWLVASDGGIFSFGDASFYGSTGALTLQQPIVSMTTTTDGKGYWLVASDGGIFSFGDARYYGSTAGTPGEPVQRLVAAKSGQGYWVVAQNGTFTTFGDVADQTIPALALFFRPVTPGDKAVLFAFDQVGKPYIYGGNGPVGYDCSGLALASWVHADDVSFARVADDQYHTAGTPVSLDDLQAGDLVFWGDSQTDWTSVYHTAIYVGGDQIVEATGDVVQLNSLGQWGNSDLMPNGRRP